MEGSRIMHVGGSTLIIDGGNPLHGCPTDWKLAKEWASKANEDSEGSFERPTWSWDCGYKLDFDGPILRISSRFYPPKTHYGPKWDGKISVYIYDREVLTKSLICETLDQLKDEAEKYVYEIKRKVENIFIELDSKAPQHS